MLLKIAVIFTILTFCSGAKVLLVSFDGFRWDYLTKYSIETSWFNYLRNIGGSTTDGSITGTFASFTFPSHFTIATGLFEESHGIVQGTMWDPTVNKTFVSTNPKDARDPFWFKEATPIWINAQIQGKLSATYFWPGSETSYKGITQSFRMFYNASVPYNSRVDTVIEWLSNDIEFATLYFDQPDAAGHQGGPNSPLVKNALTKANNVLRYLIQRLKNTGLYDKVNLIVLSDHGMAEVKNTTIIPLYKYFENRTDLYSRVVSNPGPVVQVVPRPGKTEQLYQFLTDLVKSKPDVANMTVYKKSAIPPRLHYQHNVRIQEIVLVADLGYFIAAKFVNIPIPPAFGAHGYDNAYPQMRPIFMATGPNIVPTKVKPFRQVDVYNLISRILEIKPTANNGSWDNVSALYKSSGSRIIYQPLTVIIAILLRKLVL